VTLGAYWKLLLVQGTKPMGISVGKESVGKTQTLKEMLKMGIRRKKKNKGCGLSEQKKETKGDCGGGLQWGRN